MSERADIYHTPVQVQLPYLFALIGLMSAYIKANYGSCSFKGAFYRDQCTPCIVMKYHCYDPLLQVFPTLQGALRAWILFAFSLYVAPLAYLHR